ncbi:KH domain-containing protein [Colletotrichum nymphaeae SA-01]|uniref:KH domain-containing protein n=1 Tax=Colletotrichum nymphaeae SA-01 TaxID=1460502 RepID=A0A135TVI9_9PEZI|nr:KH domain-containing protein [Colletotrichum nymphaeae SA-01]
MTARMEESAGTLLIRSVQGTPEGIKGAVWETWGAPETSREVLKIGHLHGLRLLLCDHLAQKKMLPQSTERIVEVQGTPEGIKGAIWEICKCLVDDWQIRRRGPPRKNSGADRQQEGPPPLQVQVLPAQTKPVQVPQRGACPRMMSMVISLQAVNLTIDIILGILEVFVIAWSLVVIG